MAKKKADYLDGLYEVASQIKDARGEVEAQLLDGSLEAGTAEATRLASELDDHGTVRTASIRTDSKRISYIRTRPKRLHHKRSSSEQVQDAPRQPMDASLPESTPLPESDNEQQPASAVAETVEPAAERSEADAVDAAGPSAEVDSRRATRKATELESYIRIGNKRLYVKRSPSKRTALVDWQLMAPKLPKPIELQDSFYAMDNEVDDLLMPDLDLVQQSIYRFLYRNAYGWKRCTCAVSFESIQKGTGIKSRVTVQKAIDHLLALGCISVEYEKSPVTPRVYRVYLPCEMKAYEGRSKRSETIRLGNIRLGNDELYVHGMNVYASGSKRIDNERIQENGASSCSADEPSDAENASKYSTKNSTVKNSSRRDAILLLLSSHRFKVNPEKVDAWADNDSLGLDMIESYIQWVAGKVAKGECKKAAPFLVKAIDGRWPMDEETPRKREAAQPVAAADPKAEEDEAIRERIAAMSPEEQETLAQQALDLARDEWIYKQAKTQEVRDNVCRGKMMEIVRETLREAAAASDECGADNQTKK